MATVLIVEDEGQVLVLSESYLAEQGHDTRSARTVAEAIAIIESDTPIDVLFTDIGLSHDGPQAGLELAKQAAERRPDLKVLYTTGHTVTDGMKALFVPNSAVLEKPYTVEQLITALTVYFRLGPQPRRR